MRQKRQKSTQLLMRNHSYTSTHILAKEGWIYSILALMVFLIAYAFSFFAWFFFLLFLGTVFCYRNPERIAEEDDERCLIAPMDGVVTDISKISLNDNSEALRIVIRKSLFGVGVLRAPLAMTLSDVKNRFGLFMDSSSALFSNLSEQKSITCKSQFASIKLVISAGLWSQKMTLFKKAGAFKAGERIGFLRDGEMALLLPLDTRVKVSLSDEVKAGATILGYLAYKDKDDK